MDTAEPDGAFFILLAVVVNLQRWKVVETLPKLINFQICNYNHNWMGETFTKTSHLQRTILSWGENREK